MSPQAKNNAEFNGFAHMNTTDATRISYAQQRKAQLTYSSFLQVPPGQDAAAAQQV